MLIVSVPELRARALDAARRARWSRSPRSIAERSRPAADDPAVRTFTGALIGVSISAMLAAAEDPGADYIELLDAALAHLEAGLPL